MSSKLRVAKKAAKPATISKAPPSEKARNTAFAKLVQAFTRDVQAEGKKYGIKEQDLKVVVHIQIPEQEGK